MTDKISLALPSAMGEPKRFPNGLEGLAAAADYIEGEFVRLGCPMSTLMRMQVSFDEIGSNVLHYSKASMFAVALAYDAAAGEAWMEVSDDGIAYNPLECPEPDVTSPLAERKVGGLGIFIVKKAMDSVVYERRNDHNVLTMVKNSPQNAQ